MIQLEFNYPNGPSTSVSHEICAKDTGTLRKATLFIQKTVIASVVAGSLIILPHGADANIRNLGVSGESNHSIKTEIGYGHKVQKVVGENDVFKDKNFYTAREMADVNVSEYVKISNIKNSAAFDENVFIKPEIGYNIKNQLINSITLGDMSTWMEGMFMKNNKKDNVKHPVKKCKASVRVKNHEPMKIKDTFVDFGVERLIIKQSIKKKITATVRRAEPVKKIYG
ncbi:hypothetical protein V6C27_03065 [Peptococcaceae bacterium 1198_IL3148]